MESLVSKLQKEVGLTEEQATKSVDCVRKYMEDNDLYDWDDFFESKAKDMSEKAKKAWSDLTGKTHSWTDKFDDWADKAGQVIKDARNKAADMLSDKD